MKKVSVFTSNADFKPEKIMKISKSAFGLCDYIIGMENYYKLMQTISQSKNQLKNRQEEFYQK